MPARSANQTAAKAAAKPKPIAGSAQRVQQWRDANRDHVNLQAATRREALVSEGLCVQCRRKNRDLSRRRCPRCAKSARLAAKASREARRAS